MSKPRWVSATPAAYAALATKDENALYFLTSGEIYKGAKNFTESVILVDAFPATGAVGKIYVLNSTLEGKVFNGTTWTRVIEPVLVGALIDGTTQDGVVPAETIKDYVTSKVSAAVSTGAITDVSYDNTNDVIKVTKNGTTTDLTLDGLVKSVTYTNNVLTMNLTGLAPIEVNFPADNFVKSGVYVEADKTIVLTLQDDSTVVIPATDLVDIYTATATNTIDMTVVGNVISGNVKVSATAGNKIATNADGLYVSNEVVATGKAGEIVAANADGTVSASGVKAGGATLSATPDAITLATEASVEAIRAALAANVANKFDSANVVTSIRSTATAEDTKVASEKAVAAALDLKVDKANISTVLDEVAPSDLKVASEKAVVDAMSWTILS